MKNVHNKSTFQNWSTSYKRKASTIQNLKPSICVRRRLVSISIDGQTFARINFLIVWLASLVVSVSNWLKPLNALLIMEPLHECSVDASVQWCNAYIPLIDCLQTDIWWLMGRFQTCNYCYTNAQLTHALHTSISFRGIALIAVRVYVQQAYVCKNLRCWKLLLIRMLIGKCYFLPDWPLEVFRQLKQLHSFGKIN